jgi:hypothetical protein
MGRILRLFLRACVLMMAAELAVLGAHGQGAPVAQPQTVVDILHELSDKAEVIFAGEVLAIRRPNDGVVEVEFRVDQAILGCAAGTRYILREWSGLWAGDTQRYHVGQRLLMLLHAPGAAGMSSPVGGLDGAIPIRQGGADASMAGVATPSQPPFVDLRWLGARLPRTVSYSSVPAHAAKMTAVATPSAVGQTMTAAAGSAHGSAPAQQASVDAVIGMMTSWQKGQHAAP